MRAPWGASAPPRVHARLRSAPDGPLRVLHAGDHAVYLEVGGWCVGIVGPSAVQVPCALRVAEVRPVRARRPHGACEAYVEGGNLRVDGTTLSIGRFVGACVPPLGDPVADGATPRTDPVPVRTTPWATVAGFVEQHVPRGRLGAGTAARLIGRGEGLTPLGDDVLAGWLALHRAAGVATPEVDEVLDGVRDRTTVLSATLLDCARHGEVVPQYAAWVRAIGTDDEPATVRALHAVGATSGAGLHAGGQLALDQVRAA